MQPANGAIGLKKDGVGVVDGGSGLLTANPSCAAVVVLRCNAAA